MAKPITQLLNTAKYKNVEHTKQDILNVIKHFKSLAPKLERYTFPNGITKELVCLDGTIPVVFRDATYNIPVCIFISENHPFEGPICYVRPTRDMTIKTSRHVDGSGRVYLPYLSEWKRDQCDIIGVIHIMRIVFGNMCPVYQKTADYDPNASSNSSMPALPNSFYPSGANGSIGGSQNRSTGPTAGSSMPTPPSNAYPFSTPKPYSSSNDNGNTITGQHIRASLVSAVEDKLKISYKERVHQIQDEIELLKKTSNDLNKGKIQLDQMKEKMARELSDLTVAKDKLQELDEQLQEFIVRYDKEGEDINPDEVYGPTQPVFKQLLDAFAEENAVVDAIYYTGEGLRKDVITLDVFLKSVRDLSRRQFMLRALMQSCRAKASLPN